MGKGETEKSRTGKMADTSVRGGRKDSSRVQGQETENLGHKEHLHTNNVLCLTVLLCFTGCILGKCTISKYLRGKHMLLKGVFERFPGEIIIRSHDVDINTEGERHRLDCVDTDMDTILLGSEDKTGVLCLQFSPMADAPAEYNIRRLNYPSADGKIFTPSAISGDVTPTVDNQCTLPINSDMYSRSAEAGCSFPPELQTAWTYNRGPLAEVVFKGTSAAMTLTNGEKFTAECELYDLDRSSVYRLAMRVSVGPQKDGVMCLVLRPLSGGKLLAQLAQKGDRYENLVKTISFHEPIYLHTTCDLMDTPLEGVVTQTSVVTTVY